jgi:hypothetical protein
MRTSTPAAGPHAWPYRGVSGRCRQLLRELDAFVPRIPGGPRGAGPTTTVPAVVGHRVGLLCAAVAARSGRCLQVELVPDGLHGATGLWVSTPVRDLVFVDARLSRALVDQTVLHELGHIVLDHCGVDLVGWAVNELHHLSPDVLTRTLARARASDADEAEAELFADTAAGWLARSRRAGFRPAPQRSAGRPGGSVEQPPR